MRVTLSYRQRRVLGRLSSLLQCALAVFALAWFAADARAQFGGPPGEANAAGATAEAPLPEAKKFPPPEGAVRLSPKHDIWVDKERGVVIMDGRVCLRRGMLEMFACLAGTKEHESVIAVDTQAFLAHTGLLALGFEPGSPVQWDPEYEPPKGPEIEILLQWRDPAGELKKARAQDWVRDARTKEPMKLPFVFAGSGFWVDSQTGQRRYLAESGDFICVSNFGTAMLDVPAESTQSNEGLLFEAWTERVPALGTPVRVELKPKPDPNAKPAADKPAAVAPPEGKPEEPAGAPQPESTTVPESDIVVPATPKAGP